MERSMGTLSSDSAEAASRVLALTWAAVAQYGAQRYSVLVGHNSARYRFNAQDGRSGEGEIHPRFCEALIHFLESNRSVRVDEDELSITRSAQPGEFVLERRVPQLVAVTGGTVTGGTVAGRAVAEIAESPRLGDDYSASHSSARLNQARHNPPVRSPGIRSAVDEPASSHSAKILIVEDNPNFSRVLARFLGQAGYQVQSCVDGAQALALLQQDSSIVLLVTDRHMPNLTGDELIREVRCLERYHDLPVVLLSSDTGAAGVVTALECGADLILAKSEDPRVIRAYVQRLLKRVGGSSSAVPHAAPPYTAAQQLELASAGEQ